MIMKTYKMQVQSKPGHSKEIWQFSHIFKTDILTEPDLTGELNNPTVNNQFN